jgi:hypothetical protein
MAWRRPGEATTRGGQEYDVRRAGEPTASKRVLTTEARERLTAEEQVRTAEAGSGRLDSWRRQTSSTLWQQAEDGVEVRGSGRLDDGE